MGTAENSGRMTKIPGTSRRYARIGAGSIIISVALSVLAYPVDAVAPPAVEGAMVVMSIVFLLAGLLGGALGWKHWLGKVTVAAAVLLLILGVVNYAIFLSVRHAERQELQAELEEQADRHADPYPDRWCRLLSRHAPHPLTAGWIETGKAPGSTIETP